MINKFHILFRVIIFGSAVRDSGTKASDLDHVLVINAFRVIFTLIIHPKFAVFVVCAFIITETLKMYLSSRKHRLHQQYTSANQTE